MLLNSLAEWDLRVQWSDRDSSHPVVSVLSRDSLLDQHIDNSLRQDSPLGQFQVALHIFGRHFQPFQNPKREQQHLIGQNERHWKEKSLVRRIRQVPFMPEWDIL